MKARRLRSGQARFAIGSGLATLLSAVFLFMSVNPAFATGPTGKATSSSAQKNKSIKSNAGEAAANQRRINPNPYGKLPKTSDINRRPANDGQYDKVPSANDVNTNSRRGAASNSGRSSIRSASSSSSGSGADAQNDENRRPASESPYGRVPSGRSLRSRTNSVSQGDDNDTNQLPANNSPYGKVPSVRVEGAAPRIVATTPRRNQAGKRYRTLNLASRAKRLFRRAIVQPFSRAVAKVRKTHNAGIRARDAAGDPNYDFDMKPRPVANAGELGRYLGGGANALVYTANNHPGYVYKLVRLDGPDIDAASTAIVPLPDNINVITDQMAGREVLNRFKQTHQGRLLGSLVEVADVAGEPEIFEVPSARGTHRFARTLEENISTPVYYRDSGGRYLRVLDENGNGVEATNAIERLDIVAKNNMRLKALAAGQNPKLSDMKPLEQDLQDAITPNQELAINAVIRGLNKHGIVWTDHKMDNFDVVADPRSPLGYKVKFFDFDGFRVVNGKKPSERANAARDLQLKYDHDHNQAPGDRELNRQANLFDFTAVEGQFIKQVSSQNANWYRKKYKRYDNVDEANFNQELAKQTQGRVAAFWDR